MQNLTREELKELIKEIIREVLIEEGIHLKNINKNPILNQKIRSLNLSAKVLNALTVNKIYTVADLIRISRDKLSSFRNIGKKGIEEIGLKLKELDLELLA